MHVAASFVIAKSWKQSQSPSAGKWIQKLLHTHRAESCLAVKKNELVLRAASWMNHSIWVWVREARQKGVHTRWFDLNKTLENTNEFYSNREQINRCLKRQSVKWERGSNYQGTNFYKGNLGLMDPFTVLMAVMVSCVWVFVCQHLWNSTL